jgi:hypothetical protein
MGLEIVKISGYYKVIILCIINLSKPTGHVMHHQQFNIQQLYALLNVFCIYLRTNSDLCHLQHKLVGLMTKRTLVYLKTQSLPRCKDWVFK